MSELHSRVEGITLPDLIFELERTSECVVEGRAAMREVLRDISQYLEAAAYHWSFVWAASTDVEEVSRTLRDLYDELDGPASQLKVTLETEEATHRPTQFEEHNTHRVVMGRVA